MKHILFLFLFAGSMIAQTHNGRKIVIKNNGTWEYAEPETPITNADCIYQKNERDEFDGKLYQFTDVKPFFSKDLVVDEKRISQNYETGFIQMRRVNTALAVHLKMLVKTSKFSDIYGYIAKGARMIILFEDGTNVTCTALSSQFGDKQQDYLYQVEDTFLINSQDDLNLLCSKVATKIKLEFSKRYEVFEVDGIALRNLANCIK
jgi:23S rRNA pseudoU1915 N3-methylase RlmH